MIKTNIKFILSITFSWVVFSVNAQCTGEFGDPIFTEDFGTRSGEGYGSALPSGITTYTFNGGLGVEDGEYAIATNTNLSRTDWHNSSDHTEDESGTGLMMIVNADYTPGEFYRRKVIDLCDSQTYQFSAWIMNALPAGLFSNQIPIQVNFQIQDEYGSVLDQTTTPQVYSTNSPEWEQYTFDFDIPAGETSVYVVMVNVGGGGGGNDLAIDDITLSPCSSGDLNLETDISIFSDGIYDTSHDFNLTADVSSANYTSPYFLFQQSSDGGNTWTDLNTASATNTYTVLGGTYNKGDLFRVTVGESTNFGNANCMVIIGPYEVIVNNPPEYYSCDTDNDGWAIFDLDKISDDVIGYIGSSESTEQVYITRAYNGISRVINLSTSPEVEIVCNGGLSNYFEIAVNQDEEVFVSSSSSVYRLDESTCNFTFVANLPSNSSYAMSFDTQNNLYVGGSHSSVYRAESSDLSNFTLWHNFGSGASGGDFVMIGDYMYIVWEESNGDFNLYKITVDADNQYVSHQNLGRVKSRTFGLAAELGKLYGVTPSELYSIDLNTLQTTTIAANPSGSDSEKWWGAAGKHEAVNYQVSFYETGANAESGTGTTISGNYSIASPSEVTVYARIEDVNSGEYTIIPVVLITEKSPETVDNIYSPCGINNQADIDLEELYPLVISNPDDYEIHVFDSSSLTHEITGVQTLSDGQIIYLEVINNLAEFSCSSIAEVTIEIKNAPQINLDNSYSICEGETLTLVLDNSYSDYLWEGLQSPDDVNNDATSSNVNLTQTGTYTVTVIDTEGCSAIHNFEIVYNVDIVIFSTEVYNQNSIDVETNGTLNVEYSLDGINWQSNLFTNLDNGVYTIYARSDDKCGIAQADFAIFNITNVITPNNDGYNDIWVINGLELYPDSTISIHDRYGKLIKEEVIDGSQFEWDGTYLGRKLPTADYWYVLQLSDGRQFSGNITLKNN